MTRTERLRKLFVSFLRHRETEFVVDIMMSPVDENEVFAVTVTDGVSRCEIEIVNEHFKFALKWVSDSYSRLVYLKTQLLVLTATDEEVWSAVAALIHSTSKVAKMN